MHVQKNLLPYKSFQGRLCAHCKVALLLVLLQLLLLVLRRPASKNAVVHIILGMWMDGWGMELSETLHVQERRSVRLSQFSQEVKLIGI